MIWLITGASHTGKTQLAQRLLETYRAPYLSIDHLKMGMIRSGMLALTVQDDEPLTEALWPVVREIVKTAAENRQHLIVEGGLYPLHLAGGFSGTDVGGAPLLLPGDDGGIHPEPHGRDPWICKCHRTAPGRRGLHSGAPDRGEPAESGAVPSTRLPVLPYCKRLPAGDCRGRAAAAALKSRFPIDKGCDSRYNAT